MLRYVMVIALAAAVAATSVVCPRYAEGSNFVDPDSVSSQNGILSVNATYTTRVNDLGMNLYCTMLPNGKQSPVFRVKPGDHLRIKLKNDLPHDLSGHSMPLPANFTKCGSHSMDSSSTNVHFHGTHTAPICKQDGVVHTIIDAGGSLDYDLYFPQNHPTAAYGYHPHVHGLAQQAVQGGATSAIIVEGIETYQPAVAGLGERILILRDNNPNANFSILNPACTALDISLNHIPVSFPDYNPVILNMKPGEKQLWRVLNALADNNLVLQVQYDGIIQTLQQVASDGVPFDDQRVKNTESIYFGPYSRAEFIIQGPPLGTAQAFLMLGKVATGLCPAQSNQGIMKIIPDVNAREPAVKIPHISPRDAKNMQLVSNLVHQVPSTTRKLYFSIVIPAQGLPLFYITVDGQTPTPYDPSNPPGITTTQGVVEDWIIENRSTESHAFHIHQTHFMQTQQNGVDLAPQSHRLSDTMIVPWWDGVGPFPSITVRIDFRNPQLVGRFVYHCHILFHEDNGMMSDILILPPANRTYGNNQYLLVKNPLLTPGYADLHCQTLGGRLATIDGPLVNKFIKENIAPGTSEFWIGLKKVSGDAYSWISGDTNTYRNWGSGSANPNTVYSGVVFVGDSSKGTVGAWKPLSSTLQKPFLCKIPLTRYN
jgi:FtsP/CotA-like multicopper oxidase with cupredoxin domain